MLPVALSCILFPDVALKEIIRPMTPNARVTAIAALLCAAGMLSGCNQLKARDQLSKGVAAFKNAQYEQATNNFQKAIQYDPNYDTAKLYLATAYAYQVVPNNTEDPNNMKMAQNAINGFNNYLQLHPNDKVSLQQLAALYREIKQFPQAKAYEEKVIEVDPKDSEAHYTIGQVDWSEAYNNAVKVLAADGLTDKGDGNPKLSKKACAQLQQLNTNLVEDGLKQLQQAVQINPNYGDAYSYLNLMYRRKADLECGNDSARKADLALADKANDEAMQARKIEEQKKEEKASHGGVTMGQ